MGRPSHRNERDPIASFGLFPLLVFPLGGSLPEQKEKQNNLDGSCYCRNTISSQIGADAELPQRASLQQPSRRRK
jgi:hypothetical protein